MPRIFARALIFELPPERFARQIITSRHKRREKPRRIITPIDRLFPRFRRKRRVFQRFTRHLRLHHSQPQIAAEEPKLRSRPRDHPFTLVMRSAHIHRPPPRPPTSRDHLHRFRTPIPLRFFADRRARRPRDPIPTHRRLDQRPFTTDRFDRRPMLLNRRNKLPLPPIRQRRRRRRKRRKERARPLPAFQHPTSIRSDHPKEIRRVRLKPRNEHARLTIPKPPTKISRRNRRNRATRRIDRTINRPILKLEMRIGPIRVNLGHQPLRPSRNRLRHQTIHHRRTRSHRPKHRKRPIFPHTRLQNEHFPRSIINRDRPSPTQIPFTEPLKQHAPGRERRNPRPPIHEHFPRNPINSKPRHRPRPQTRRDQPPTSRKLSHSHRRAFFFRAFFQRRLTFMRHKKPATRRHPKPRPRPAPQPFLHPQFQRLPRHPLIHFLIPKPRHMPFFTPIHPQPTRTINPNPINFFQFQFFPSMLEQALFENRFTRRRIKLVNISTFKRFNPFFRRTNHIHITPRRIPHNTRIINNNPTRRLHRPKLHKHKPPTRPRKLLHPFPQRPPHPNKHIPRNIIHPNTTTQHHTITNQPNNPPKHTTTTTQTKHRRRRTHQERQRHHQCQHDASRPPELRACGARSGASRRPRVRRGGVACQIEALHGAACFP